MVTLKGWEQALISQPHLLTKLGVMIPGEYWLAQKTAHGFEASRKARAEIRDGVLRNLVVQSLRSFTVSRILRCG